jgi:hypothetical protein
MTDFDGEILEWIQVAKGDKCPLCKGTGKIRDGHMTCPKCGGKKVAKDANESLATVMRHDQDHDDWHRSHGDAPCTSEADCAAKRAKYAEVKAEQGVTKGDTPGHAFHGNQWTNAQNLSDQLLPANNLHLHHEDGADPEKVAGQHEIASMLHSEMSQSLRKLPTVPKSPIGKIVNKLLYKASDLHDLASQAHEKASQATLDHGISQESINAAMTAVRASRAATSATNEAFDVAENAGMAPALNNESNLMSKASEIAKGGPGSGAQAGHPFEGNQYTTGHAYNGRTGADKGAISTIPKNVGHRDFDANTTLGQIGRMNVLAVSGGRVHTLFADDKRGGGKAIGLELPVGHGYKVRTFLADNDSYTVQRVFSRAGKDTVKGEETDVYAPEVGEAVYRAGMYVNVPFGGHNP